MTSPHLDKRSRNYGDAEFLDEQPRLSDLVPRRLLAFVVLLGIGVGAIAGLVALDASAARLPHPNGGGDLAALDLGVRGSLATWLSSMLLGAAALTAVVVYGVRRFKADDYRGHYRVWLWAAACWLLMSIDTTADLHHLFAALMVSATGARLWGDGSIWWVVAYVFLLGGIGTRLLVDMRSCWLSAATLLLGLACYAGAVAGQFGWLEVPPDFDPIVAIRVAVLAGNLLVFLAMGLHARHVILDAKGLLPQKGDAEVEADLERARRLAMPTAAAGASLTVHPPHTVPCPNPAILSPSRALPTRPVYTPVASSPAPVSPASSSPGWPNGPVTRKLTKQEKKALRERLERARRDRQARAG